jgi:hypothetical protein
VECRQEKENAKEQEDATGARQMQHWRHGYKY